ncbi:uroporphyrinogen decarboxylase family protein [Leadbettera azotonutricia]|uniref:Putative methylcobamide:CoM methyltransferase MtbA (Methylcobamide:CoM methyltransferase II isozyme A) (MT2-A) n=1 Tax=Leadbettera azotonutricia (strain ATCC BAA-888 / DSM 13862 / ZAS-9) TaxID=545695 RepID=F5YEM9_LEAAZ|nr:uroporphyrinogen decarboxylase family protein [Leadbettera azotonutricia]AEF82644.1 putative methylcobamide:CoM methyltransferase MtbA (Methylcobamide:CoM methyltransferase II isozyme A) (MT2-A) [Leadbettera azotonutricia ZAS-9]
MNSKEIIQNLLELKPTPRQPATLMSAGAWALNSNGLSLERALAAPVEETADILYRAYNEVGSDIVWAMSGYNNIVIGAIGGKIKFRTKGTPDVIEILVKKPSDVDTINTDVIKNDERVQTLLKVTKLLAEKVKGENYVALTRWGPFTLAGLLYGAENLMRDIYRNPDSVRHILDFTADLYLKYAQLYIDNGVDFFLLAEPTTSGDMISRKHFETFAVPAFKKVFTELRKKRVRTALHICGNIENRLDLLADIGAELISVDYKVSLKKCRDTFDGKIAFAGNMNPVAVMQRESPEGVVKACEECIAAAGEGLGYLLMPGCDIPPATPATNIKAMTQTGKSHIFGGNNE